MILYKHFRKHRAIILDKFYGLWAEVWHGKCKCKVDVGNRPSKSNQLSGLKKNNMKIRLSNNTERSIALDVASEIFSKSENNEYDGIAFCVLPQPIKLKYARGHKTCEWNVLGVSDTENENLYVGYLDSNDNPVFYPIEHFEDGVVGLLFALTR